MRLLNSCCRTIVRTHVTTQLIFIFSESKLEPLAYSLAETMVESLEILRQTDWSSSVDLAEILHNLGVTFIKLGRFDEAQSHLEEALALYMSIQSEDKANSEMSQTLTNLGYLHSLLGNLDDALNYLKQSLDMKYILYEANTSHPSIAETLGYIGNVYYQQEEYKNAILYIQQALDMLKDAEQPYNKEIALNLCNLGQAYEYLSDIPAALACYEKALPMMLELYGELHESTQRILESLNEIHQHPTIAVNAATSDSH